VGRNRDVRYRGVERKRSLEPQALEKRKDGKKGVVIHWENEIRKRDEQENDSSRKRDSEGEIEELGSSKEIARRLGENYTKGSLLFYTKEQREELRQHH